MIYSFDDSQRYYTFYLMLNILWVKINISCQKSSKKPHYDIFIRKVIYLLFSVKTLEQKMNILTGGLVIVKKILIFLFINGIKYLSSTYYMSLNEH